MAPTGPLAVDLQALQSPNTRGRGIARYATSWALALEAARPELVGCYLLSADLPPPGEAEQLLATGKVSYRGHAQLPASVRALHLLSPLDGALSIGSLLPSEVVARGLHLSATVVDCIPARDPLRELIDPGERRRYRTRLEIVRAAEQLHVLSTAVAEELAALLGIDRRRIVHVGGAADRSFTPPPTRAAARQHAIEALTDEGLVGSYVLYPSGSHPRKNNEALVRAFARLPDSLVRQHQLLISGELDAPTVHHFRVLADSLGIAGRVVLPGHLADPLLLSCYQGAELVCVPSLAEGFGLPIIEAIATGTPVIASDLPPFDELLGEAGRFDPTDPQAIAAALTAVLERPPAERADYATPAARIGWDEVASRTAAAFDALLGGPSRPRRAPARRRRIAFVTPLPPAPSGTAHYGYRLAEEMAADDDTVVDLFVDGASGTPLAPASLAVYGVHALEQVEALSGPYDDVLYALGNSHHHLGALALLRRRPGTVFAHDVRLSNLYRHENGDPGFAPGGLARAIHRMYDGALPVELGASGSLSEQDLARFGLLMSREVIGAAHGFLVTSSAAAALARAEAGSDLEERVAVVPFALEAPSLAVGELFDKAGPPPNEPRPLWGAAPSELGERPLIAHFGIVDPVKRPHLLLEAFAALADHYPRPLLAFVGPIAAALSAELLATAERLDITAHVVLTGALSSADYLAWLQRATVAVQPRRLFNGEASAATGECLACGLATIVSNIGWARELEDDAVVKLSSTADSIELAALLEALLTDEPRRRELGRAAQQTAKRRSFANAARVILEVLREGAARRDSHEARSPR